MAETKAVKDLTQGRAMGLILGFALPMLGGMVFQQFYNIVDTMIVGRTLGVQALAGVGATGSVNFLVIGLCNGLCSGFAIPVSQRFGAKDYSGMRRYVYGAIVLSVSFAVVVTTLVTILAPQILLWMDTPADIYPHSLSYLRVIFLGIPTVFLFSLASSVIRALGDSKAPVFFLVVASLVNVALDLTFILGFGMGVAGAAVATVLSQFISGILCIVYIRKRIPLLAIQRSERSVDGDLIKNLLMMGLPMGLQYSITAIGSVVLQTAVNGLGSMYVATMTAAGRVSMFFGMAFDAMGTTMATYTGQNIGARKVDRVNEGLRDVSILGLGYAVIAFGVLYFFGRRLATLFVSSAETQILDNVRVFLIINAAFYWALLFVNALRFMIQGMGYAGLAMLAGVMEMIARAGVAFLLIPAFGFYGACFANPAAWVAADLFLFPAYFILLNKQRKLLTPVRNGSDPSSSGS